MSDTTTIGLERPEEEILTYDWMHSEHWPAITRIISSPHFDIAPVRLISPD
jgi:hypothetical protein